MRGLAILFIFASLCELLLAQRVTNACIRCICEATSSCRKDMQCENGYCGPFYITESYWIDAYRPCIGNDRPLTPGAYARCSENLVCSVRTIKRYMGKYARDCTGDERVNCFDYAKIHRLGPFACGRGVNPKFIEVINSCLRKLNKDDNGDDIVTGVNGTSSTPGDGDVGI